MKPVAFPESNRTLAKPEGWSDEDCSPLPIHNDGFQCISLWEMTWPERLSALLFGRVWLHVISGHTQPPVGLQVTRTIFKQEKGTRIRQAPLLWFFCKIDQPIRSPSLDGACANCGTFHWKKDH